MLERTRQAFVKKFLYDKEYLELRVHIDSGARRLDSNPISATCDLCVRLFNLCFSHL